MIKDASLSDIPIIIHIAYKSWEVAYKDILSPTQKEYMLNLFYTAAAIKKQFIEDRQKFILYQDQGITVGFASYELHNPTDGTCKIHKLYLLPNTQGKGFGAKLIDSIILRAKENSCRKLILNVNKFNKAKQFYEKMGFSVSKEEVIEIGEGYVMDDYVMQKNISI